MAAPLSGVNVDFYPNENALDSSNTSTANQAGGDDTLNLATVSDGDLNAMSGGQGISDLQLNTATNTAAGASNSVSGNVNTGTIHDANVSNMSGFNTILLNTGNNVTMQSVTQVNIILK